MRKDGLCDEEIFSNLLGEFNGTPYVWGGGTTEGSDCSGTVCAALNAMTGRERRVTADALYRTARVGSSSRAEPVRREKKMRRLNWKKMLLVFALATVLEVAARPQTADGGESAKAASVQKSESETSSQKDCDAAFDEIASLIDGIVDTALGEYSALEAVNEELRTENKRLERKLLTVQEKRRFWLKVSAVELCVIGAGVYGMYRLLE